MRESEEHYRFAAELNPYAELDGIAVELPRLTKPFRQAELACKIAEVQQAAG